MESFIQNPNLPANKVSLVAIDCRVPDGILEELHKMNIRVVKTQKIKETYEAISCHPDIMMCHVGGNEIVAAPNVPDAMIYELEDEGFHIISGSKTIKSSYPEDILYNTAVIGGFAVCSVKNTDKVLIDNLEKKDIKIIDVKQGYSKCSACIVDNRAVITSDTGIYKVLMEQNIDVLLITPGFIDLYDMNYGFIGGAGSALSADEIAFSGNIVLHPDYFKIQNFLKKHDKKIINLNLNRLIDLGTIIPLKEYCILGL